MAINQQNSHTLLIVIPCYNEEKRLYVSSFYNFLKEHRTLKIVFSNDGSIDDTVKILNSIKDTFPEQVSVFNLPKNKGKAEAVRLGILYGLENFKVDKIAYLDADLSTSLNECLEISKVLNHKIQFVFGSRILKLDTKIKRKFYRFFIGRFFATLISNQLKVNVYDTQCGCKIFNSDLAKTIFKEKFISRWFFDVEIFHRLISIYGRNYLPEKGREIPLKLWKDKDGSKIKISSSLSIVFDLIRIGQYYKTSQSKKSEKTQWKSIL